MRQVRKAIILMGLLLAVGAWAANIQVTSVIDNGAGTLRAAITTSNGNGVADVITFAPALAGKVIRPLTPLPILTGGSLTINGDTNADNKPDIIIKGSIAGGKGLQISSPGNVIRNLVINLFETGILINGFGATANTVAGCYIGTNAAATYSLANDHGIVISGEAANNTIGGTTAAQRNIISGNAGGGVIVNNATTARVLGNYIGTNASGTGLLSNGAGVMIYDSENCTVGNGAATGRNVISGNLLQETILSAQQKPAQPQVMPALSTTPIPDRGAGIIIHRGTGHVVSGNYIGVERTGLKPLRNGGGGVAVVNASAITIGGTTAGARNIISGNQSNTGVSASSCSGLKIQGNYIGTNVGGGRAVGNGAGVELFTCFNAMIGGAAAAARNVIGGNAGTGVAISGGATNSILGNYIGTNAAGAAALPNTFGVRLLSGATGTSIGNATAGSGNVISGCTGDGIRVDNYATDNTLIVRNLIGLDAGGVNPLVNVADAIEVTDDAGPVTIGGAASALGNKIRVRSFESGIILSSRNLSGTLVQNNAISGPTSSVKAGQGIAVDMPSAGIFDGRVANNAIQYCTDGLYVSGAFARPVVVVNNFNFSTNAVSIANGAAPDLGNLGDALANNNGANVFVRLNLTLAINNLSNKDIKAEGNDWNTTSISVIEALIFDELDSLTSGRVDYSPLIGGVIPTAVAGSPLAVTGLAAAPTARGAQIVFALSTEASITVEIMNLAGRTVARLSPRVGIAGLNSLSWDGQTQYATRAPAGRYLVRLSARADSGSSASQLTSLHLE